MRENDGKRWEKRSRDWRVSDLLGTRRAAEAGMLDLLHVSASPSRQATSRIPDRRTWKEAYEEGTANAVGAVKRDSDPRPTRGPGAGRA